ncbi:hypothetical protein [Porphyrobacter sp. HT-58-2]|uniref:hypothetical protein n=1 Tax=Porphyrobacter sp. HT-58-2 TaxID=2023229 RepID=UPI0011B0F3AB|nr:hypothetical protein [Porphyrobacter sp. HT-58-2]
MLVIKADRSPDTLQAPEVSPPMLMGVHFCGKLITEFGAQSAKAAGQLSGPRFDPSHDRNWVMGSSNRELFGKQFLS